MDASAREAALALQVIHLDIQGGNFNYFWLYIKQSYCCQCKFPSMDITVIVMLINICEKIRALFLFI